MYPIIKKIFGAIFIVIIEMCGQKLCKGLGMYEYDFIDGR